MAQKTALYSGAALLACAGIALGASAWARPASTPVFTNNMAGFDANFDVFSMEFESLGADDGNLTVDSGLGQSVAVEGGNINVSEDGVISGELEERTSYPGFADEVEQTSISGMIDNTTGTISGTYSGTDTYNVNTGETIESVTDPVSGGFTGTIDAQGNYTVNWTGSGTGSYSGVLEGYSGGSVDECGAEGCGEGEGGEVVMPPPEGPTYGGGGYDPNRSHDDSNDAPTVIKSRTDLIATQIQNAISFCDDDYPYKKKADRPRDRLDCFRYELGRIAQSLPTDGDYADMQNAISIAAAELSAVVRQNADPVVAPARKTARRPNGKLRTTAGRIRPVAAARQARANRQAAAVLDKLSTRLLRSASTSSTKRVHYERAAQAVNSAKVLLRST